MSQNRTQETVLIDANLYQYPSEVNPYPHQIITIGDMHGNSMKLLWILCYLGVLRFEHGDETWRRLWALYITDIDILTPLQLNEFNTILNSARVGEQFPEELIFIGDILADRGQNDFFTLLIFAKIHGVIPYTILLSNHDIITLTYFQTESELDKISKVDGEEFTLSFVNLVKILQRYPLLKIQASMIIRYSYYPHMALFAYEQSSPLEYVLYSHAIFNLELLKPMLVEGITFDKDLSHIDDFLEFIDALNLKVIQWFNEKRLYTKDDFIAPIIWERKEDSYTFEYLKRFNMINVHGHVTDFLCKPDRVSLDTYLGRPIVLNEQNQVIADFMIEKLAIHKSLQFNPNPDLLQEEAPHIMGQNHTSEVEEIKPESEASVFQEPVAETLTVEDKSKDKAVEDTSLESARPLGFFQVSRDLEVCDADRIKRSKFST